MRRVKVHLLQQFANKYMQPRERAEVESGNWEEYFEAQEKDFFFFWYILNGILMKRKSNKFYIFGKNAKLVF